MSGYLNKESGAEFVAIIKPREGSHFVECFLRGAPPAPNFASKMTHIFTNESLPAFPAMPLHQARKTAIEQARILGYFESEIIWEDEQGFPLPFTYAA